MLIPGMIFDSVANFVRPPAPGFGIRLYGSSSGSVGLKPAAAAGSVDYQLPAADGSNTNVLQTNGSGVLSWAASGGGASGANPTASVGLSAVNGSATTFLRSDGAPALSQAIVPTWTGSHTFALTAGTGTQAPGITFTGAAHTTLTASTESEDIFINLSRTVQWATGAITTQRAVNITAPTYTFVAASTITNAVTFHVGGYPIAGANATITNAWTARFAGTTQAVASAATDVPFVVQGFASQSANLQNWRNSSSTVLASITSDGRGLFGGSYDDTVSAVIAQNFNSGGRFVSRCTGGAGTAAFYGFQDSAGFSLTANGYNTGSDGGFNFHTNTGRTANELLTVCGGSLSTSYFNFGMADVGTNTVTNGVRINGLGVVSIYGAIATAGIGVTAVYAAANITAQSAAATITSYTTPAVDGDYEVSASLNVTAAVAISTSLTVTYTDVNSASQTLTLPVQAAGGTGGTYLTNGLVIATGDYSTPVHKIRVKASTTITIKTATGTFTTVTYSASANIKQAA